MKKSIFGFLSIAFLVLGFALMAGCGGKKDAAGAGAESAADAASETSAAAAEKTAKAGEQKPLAKPAELEEAVNALIEEVKKENPDLAKAEAPIQMTYFFIRALQTNNQKAVLGMLTQDAYQELAQREGVPCPEFIQNSEVALGNVQYLSDEKDETKVVGARVGTIWRVKAAEGTSEENIAWVFRFEDDAWLVAGMISVLDPKYPPILINFEDLKETEQQFQELEKEIARMEAEAAKKPEGAGEGAVSDEGTADSEIAEGAEDAAEDGPKAEDGVNEADGMAANGVAADAGTETAAPGLNETEKKESSNESNPENSSASLPDELPAALPTELP